MALGDEHRFPNGKNIKNLNCGFRVVYNLHKRIFEHQSHVAFLRCNSFVFLYCFSTDYGKELNLFFFNL